MTKKASPVFATCLGVAIAWATTRMFHFDFYLGLALGLAVAMGWFSHTYSWLRYGSPLFVGLGWYTQTWIWAWAPIWPMIMLGLVLASDAQAWLSLSPKITRRTMRLVAYVSLLLAVALGGMSVWCWVALFTLPLIWQDVPNEELSFLMTLFITVGYLIKGLIR